MFFYFNMTHIRSQHFNEKKVSLIGHIMEFIWNAIIISSFNLFVYLYHILHIHIKLKNTCVAHSDAERRCFHISTSKVNLQQKQNLKVEYIWNNCRPKIVLWIIRSMKQPLYEVLWQNRLYQSIISSNILAQRNMTVLNNTLIEF